VGQTPCPRTYERKL